MCHPNWTNIISSDDYELKTTHKILCQWWLQNVERNNTLPTNLSFERITRATHFCWNFKERGCDKKMKTEMWHGHVEQNDIAEWENLWSSEWKAGLFLSTVPRNTQQSNMSVGIDPGKLLAVGHLGKPRSIAMTMKSRRSIENYNQQCDAEFSQCQHILRMHDQCSLYC